MKLSNILGVLGRPRKELALPSSELPTSHPEEIYSPDGRRRFVFYKYRIQENLLQDNFFNIALLVLNGDVSWTELMRVYRFIDEGESKYGIFMEIATSDYLRMEGHMAGYGVDGVLTLDHSMGWRAIGAPSAETNLVFTRDDLPARIDIEVTMLAFLQQVRSNPPNFDRPLLIPVSDLSVTPASEHTIPLLG